MRSVIWIAMVGGLVAAPFIGRALGEDTLLFRSPALEFRYAPALGSPRAVAIPACPFADPSDKPDGISPAHVAVLFALPAQAAGDEAKACAVPNFERAQLRVFSVAAWRKIDPKGAKTFEPLQREIAGGSHDVGAEIPFVPFIDAFPAFTEQAAYVTFGGGRGVAFLTQWMIEPDVIGPRLVYVFQGLSNDGKTYLLGTFPVGPRLALPGFTLVDKEVYEATLARYQPYAREVTAAMRAAKPTDFAPTLTELQTLLQSLQLK